SARQHIGELAAQAEDFVRILINQLPRFRKYQPAPHPREQLLSQTFFQRPELAADSRLREIQVPARARNAALPRHHPEVQQMMIIEPLHRSSTIRGPWGDTSVQTMDNFQSIYISNV